MNSEEQSMNFDYEEFYNESPVGYFTSDSSGIIIQANRTFLELIQRDAKEVIGKLGLQDVLSIGSKVYFQTHYFPLLQMDGIIREISMEILRKDRSRAPILVNTIRSRNKEDSPIFHTVVFEIVQRGLFEKELLLAKKEAEKLTNELRETNEKMRVQSELITKQNNALEELNAIKDKFFGIIAHDVRSPLRELNSFVVLITNHIDTISNQDLIKMTGQIKQSLTTTIDLAENLINWAQSQMKGYGVVPTIFPLEESVKEVVDNHLEAAHNKGISLSYTMDGNPDVKADKNQLNFIIRNLLMNAIKFTKSDGFIKIHGHQISENKTTMTVTDSGIGMSKAFTDDIFRIDVKTSKVGTGGEKGTGLGLLLVKEFVSMNNGKIEVLSKEGEGTTFSITLDADY